MRVRVRLRRDCAAAPSRPLDISRHVIDIANVHVIRATCLLQFRELVAELGGDADDILITAGLRPADAGRADRDIPLRRAIAAVEAAATVTNTPDFGRRLAGRRGIETIGPVGVAARTAPRLADAFAVFGRFIAAHSPALRVGVTPQGETAFLEFGIALDPPPRQRQAVELALGATLQILRALLGADYRPLAVRVPHAALTPAATYLRDFGCTPHFAEPAAGFVLRRVDLARRLPGHGAVHDGAVQILESMVTEPDVSVAQSVADLAVALLPTGRLSVGLVAESLDLGPRALQRRLSSEGITYAAVVDKVRRQTAERWLRDTDVELDHLTRLLGYSEQSVLTRSCHRWFGCSPTTYRASMR
jgi:AraC-like DNA-binding protein